MPKRIFISHRVDDAGGTAGRIYDALVQEFGKERVFFDGESLHRGDNWREKIEQTLDETDAMIVVIGRGWLEEFDARRSQGTRDVHKQELEAALKRQLPMFLTLVDGAGMPSRDLLPRGLKKLNEIEAQPLPQKGFQHYVERLVQDIEERLREGSGGDDHDPARPVHGTVTLTVAPYGAADYLGIATAARDAPEGATILVKPGVYLEPVVINRPLQIVADGDRDDVVLEVEDGAAITSTAQTGRVLGLRIASAARQDGVGVHVASGRLHVEQCTVSGNSREGSIGVLVDGADARPVFRDCHVHDCETGVVARGAATPRFESCEISAIVGAGVEVSDGADPAFHACRVHDIGTNGIAVDGSGTGTYEDCDITAANGPAVAAGDGADPVFRALTLRGLAKNGVFVAAGGRGTYENCRIEGCTTDSYAAVSIAEGAEPVFRDLMVVGGASNGVEVRPGGRGLFERSEISGTQSTAISVGDGADPTFHTLTLSGLGANGCVIAAGGRGTVEDCRIEGCTTGGYPAVSVGDGAEPAFRNLVITGGQSYGVWAREGSRGTFEDCRVSGSGDAGVRIEAGADPRFGTLVLARLGQNGVVVAANGRGTFEHCRIEGCTTGKYPAVWVGNGADPVFRRLVVAGGKSNGVYASEGSRGTFEDCEIAAIEVAAIWVAAAADPTFRQVRVHDGRLFGVFVDGGRGRFERCEIFRTLLSAFKVTKEGDPTVVEAHIHDIGPQVAARSGSAGRRLTRRALAAAFSAHAIASDGKGTFLDCTISATHDAPISPKTVANGQCRIERCTVDGELWTSGGT